MPKKHIYIHMLSEANHRACMQPIILEHAVFVMAAACLSLIFGKDNTLELSTNVKSQQSNKQIL